MEERKRPGGSDDSAPPAKRQAVSVNGARSHPDADLPWKDDIESFQKDAIFRQMKEYKREKVIIESQLLETEKRSKYHDDHLRILDVWFDQLIDEIKILSGEGLPPAEDGEYRFNLLKGPRTEFILQGPSRPIPPSVLFADSEKFSKHLSGRKEKIISGLSSVFSKFPPSSPEIAQLQQQISQLLAAEKKHICELQRVNAEKSQTSERLETATLRYMMAEKKLDRVKSAQVQKLEKQAMAGGGVVKEEPSSGTNGTEAVNGVTNGLVSEEVETAKNQAVAEAAKRKEQLEQLEVENKKLTEEVTSLTVKLAGLSDDDYAKTDLFKTIKSQHEDVIKRINNLEATNIQLREEAQKYQAERTAYRIKVDEEARASLSETQGTIVETEENLVRVRCQRDELLAKVAMLEASQQTNKASKEQANELVAACESRIAALESECQRLRLQIAEQKANEGHSAMDIDDLSPEEMRNRIITLENQSKLLNNELPAMETAWRKAQAAGSKKLADLATWEENIVRANADKAKADQKFFAAMKTKETLEQQIRVLRAQATKGTEVVAQLKEADSLSRSLVDKLEKQTAEMRAQMDGLSGQHLVLQQKFNESAITSEGQISQIAELKKGLEAKDTACLNAKHAQRDSEAERDKLAAQVEGLEKLVEHWKQKSTGNQTDEAALMQTMLQCQVCKSNFKDTMIKTCGHVFCNSCIQDRLINRARKCPNCGKAFGNNDTMRVHF
ncbi:BRE1-domain-containing protein [Pleomassaria siparia CBS 279.74]|uniref:E3 ubiquitin protein ligase n=1 Tax=Pleomassaria siparia CBS 279.74 TaxID=1314801 RepID=A0A6G1KS16_9PLEO|nr:BRE1-domain-containing protein [Pleomassaria siparia CBS 279.74]